MLEQTTSEGKSNWLTSIGPTVSSIVNVAEVEAMFPQSSATV